MSFVVDAAGNMDVSVWRDDVRSGNLRRRSEMVRWFAVVQSIGGEEGSVNLVDLLQQKHYSNKEYSSLFRPVVVGPGISRRGSVDEVPQAC